MPNPSWQGVLNSGSSAPYCSSHRPPAISGPTGTSQTFKWATLDPVHAVKRDVLHVLPVYDAYRRVHATVGFRALSCFDR